MNGAMDTPWVLASLFIIAAIGAALTSAQASWPLQIITPLVLGYACGYIERHRYVIFGGK